MGLAGYVTRTGRNTLVPTGEFSRQTRPSLVSASTQSIRPVDGSISSGYRELFKNRTLAGRRAAQTLTGQPAITATASRMRMVSRLRKKEKYMIWRHVVDDIMRYVFSGFHRYSPLRLVYTDIRDITSSATRKSGRKRI